jgi:capsular polysaccharide biosynthesis protein
MTNNRRTSRQLTKRWGAIYRYRLQILLGGLACAIGAFAVSSSLPRIYRATTHLLVSESRIGQPAENTNLQQMAMMPTFVPFVDNDALIEESLKKLGLDQPPYKLTVDHFRRGNYLDVRVPKSTRLLELNVEFRDARLAANLANEIAQAAVRFNDKLNAADTVATQQFLKRQLDQARAAQSDAATSRLRILEEARLEDREKELAILLDEKEALSMQLQELRQDLVQNESRSRSLEQVLAKEPEVISLKRSVTSDRFMELAAGKVFPDGTPLTVTEESINVTREGLRKDYVTATVDGAAQSAAILAAVERLNQVNRQISELIRNITALRGKIEAANQDYALAVEATQGASREYQAASVTVSSKSQDIKQIAPALIPDRPVRPIRLVNTVMGFLLGTLLFAFVAIGIESFREAAREKPDEEPSLGELEEGLEIARNGAGETKRGIPQLHR